MSAGVHLTVLGNPDNRRVAMFTAAVTAAGRPAPEVVSWRTVVGGGPWDFIPGTTVRIDSPGEDAEVDRCLRGAAEPAAHGEIRQTRRWYDGLCRALGRVAAAADRAGASLLNDVGEIAVMFDKAACHDRLHRAGVPVPVALAPPPGAVALVPPPGAVALVPQPSDWAALRQAAQAAGLRRFFVKPRHGSSASGVLAVQLGPAGRVQATTSVELVRDAAGSRLFNSLRVRTYHAEADIAAIVDRLAGDGLHVEQWFPKAGLAGRTVDLRVVVIAGRPGHVVVRGSHAPMTNLHLGGARGDLAALRAAAGPANYAAAMATCVRAAACFPGSLQVGVDLMFAPDWRRHAVAEVNAFGDLLPGLLVDGRDTYAAQVAALAERHGAGSFSAGRFSAGARR